MRHDSVTTVLFNKRNIDLNTFYSQTNFIIQDQLTIHAINMHPDDVVTFEVIYLKSGTMPEATGCYIHPGEMPAAIGATPLMCGECNEDGTPALVRLTANNPVVILDSPQGTILRAVYEGPGIADATVWAVSGTETTDLTPQMRGCPTIQCKPDPESWKLTGNRFCNAETGMVEDQYINNCGSTEWRETKEIEWVPTGKTVCNDDWNHEADEPGTTSVQEVNDCGETRWVEGEPQRWVATGVTQCLDDEDTTLAQFVNSCGDTVWLNGPDQKWTDTNVTRCEDSLVQRQQVNQCGQTRWVETEEHCGYLATYRLPCEGWAFVPGSHPPDATVEVKDCDGELLAYLYAEPRPGATTPVIEGCEGGCDTGPVLGYAVDGVHPKCDKLTVHLDDYIRIADMPKVTVEAPTIEKYLKGILEALNKIAGE